MEIKALAAYGRQIDWKRMQERFLGDENVLYFECSVGIMVVYICQSSFNCTHEVCALHYCKLYLNITFKKKNDWALGESPVPSPGIARESLPVSHLRPATVICHPCTRLGDLITSGCLLTLGLFQTKVSPLYCSLNTIMFSTSSKKLRITFLRIKMQRKKPLFLKRLVSSLYDYYYVPDTVLSGFRYLPY